MGQVAFGVQHLHGVPAAEVVSQVDGNRGWNGHVLGGLKYATGDFDEAEDSPEIAAEDDLGDEEGNVRPHVEERSAEFLDGGGNIGTDGERGEAVDPGLVIGLHCGEDPVNLALLEPTMVVAVVEEPERKERDLRRGENRV